MMNLCFGGFFADKEHLQAVIPALNDFPVVSIPNNERYFIFRRSLHTLVHKQNN